MEFRYHSSASNFGCITVAIVIVAAAILPHTPSVALFLLGIRHKRSVCALPDPLRVMACLAY
jgi:hypothetical protein